jgi:hypothetical protein
MTHNGDFSRLAVVHTAQADWQASPSPGVWRKRLDPGTRIASHALHGCLIYLKTGHPAP